jgi:hypothetical protein
MIFMAMSVLAVAMALCQQLAPAEIQENESLRGCRLRVYLEDLLQNTEAAMKRVEDLLNVGGENVTVTGSWPFSKVR